MKLKEITDLENNLVEYFSTMSDSEIVQKLIDHEGCEGFSYGLLDRARELVIKLDKEEA